ncbi:MAG: dCMP deaminase family protein [Mucinivorans sp.]
MNTDKQHDLDLRYMKMARIWAENSYCQRRKVGALIVRDKMIISDGYNGTPCGFENVCEWQEEELPNIDGQKQYEVGRTKPYVLHAEANAITKVAKSQSSSQGATLYVTASPCIECSKLIIQAGIRRVVFADDYHTVDGLALLRRAGIEVEQVTPEST